MTLAMHCSLNVTDLHASVRFYRALMGLEPVKRMNDYAKFEVTEPPLVLSLIPVPRSGQSPINHVGLRLADLSRLDAMQARLTDAGYNTSREEGVECCYSRQTKFWAADPDGTHWEIYVIHGEAATLGQTEPSAPLPVTTNIDAAPAVWTHRLTDGITAKIPHADHTLDEVLLEGTINLRMTSDEMQTLLVEAMRVLKPNGSISLHGLVASKPLPVAGPKLAGPAALVQRVPVEAEPMSALVAAGFINVQYAKLGEKPNFVVGSVEMRELLLVGRKPGPALDQEVHTVIYRGPFATLTDDRGLVYERGKRAWIDGCRYRELREGPAAAQFIFLQRVDVADPACDPASGCC